MLYALSTCVWCRKTRLLLDDLGVAYDYEYVDLLRGDERARVMDIISKANPSQNFPTLFVDGRCFVGFLEKEIREVFKK
jgi:glutaredoxin-like protein NrdH